MRETEMDTSMHTTPIDPEDAWQAQATVARFAADAEECRMLLAMLGIAEMPAPLCRKCGKARSRTSNLGRLLSAGDGLCASCFDAQRRAGSQ